VNPNPPTDTTNPGDANKPIRKIDQAFEDVARLSGSDTPPANFFQEFLEKTLSGIDAPAGAIWIKNVQGFLQLQCQVNIDNVGLDRHKNGRQSHNELLRQAFQTAKPILLEPFGSTGILEGIPAGNPTDFVVLLAPILLDEKTAVGLVEVWQEPRWDARVKRIHLNYLVQMAGYASNYVKTQQGRQTASHEQLWTQLESLTCQIHSSLDPTIVSYHIANEGRRLIGCDRLSVAIREGKKAKVEAVSGADVVEKRSSQIQLLRKLADAVFKWDEKLIYRGAKDDGLPPDVYHALDEYLAQSPAKLLVFQPLHDPREKDAETKELKPQRARSALLMECFEPPQQPEPLLARLDVIGRHGASALYNALEMRKIPLGLLWRPILKVQEGLGGRAKFLTYLISTIVVLVLLALIFVPYELKMDSKGQLLPEERVPVYAPRPGAITKINANPGVPFGRHQVVLEMVDSELQTQLQTAKNKLGEALGRANLLRQQLNSPNAQDKVKLESDLVQTEAEINAADSELNRLVTSYQADRGSPGKFQVMSPEFDPKRARPNEPQWLVINGNDWRTELLNRYVKPSDPLLRLGEINGVWEIEIRIPEKHINQVIKAYRTDDRDEELNVDLKLQNHPNATFRGKLARRKIAPAAVPNKDEHNETEPVVYAYVRVSGDDIPADEQIPRSLYLTGVEVKANIRCGKHAMGYSLFYGMWEFLNQKWFQFF
jgi:hypothetical protein